MSRSAAGTMMMDEEQWQWQDEEDQVVVGPGLTNSLKERKKRIVNKDSVEIVTDVGTEDSGHWVSSVSHSMVTIHKLFSQDM